MGLGLRGSLSCVRADAVPLACRASRPSTRRSAGEEENESRAREQKSRKAVATWKSVATETLALAHCRGGGDDDEFEVKRRSREHKTGFADGERRLPQRLLGRKEWPG